MSGFDRDVVRKKVQQQIASVLKRKKAAIKPEDIREGVSLTLQLGIDSLDILQLAAGVEKEYKLRIPEEELRAMDDLGAILKVVEKYWPQLKDKLA